MFNSIYGGATLTEKQLAVLRAAVRYFDEEFSPSGPDALTHEVPGFAVTPDDDAAVRDWLDRCEVRYLRVRREFLTVEPQSGDSVAVLLCARAIGPGAVE